LKFAGDAVFAEWRITNKSVNPRDEKEEIENCVYQAATCGADIVAKCSDYPIFDARKDDLQIATLNVHCGLAFGDIASLHVGNDYSRREFIVLGGSIDKVSKACDIAAYGELVASPEAYEILDRGTSTIQRGLFSMKQKKKPSEPVKIASRNQCFFQKKKLRVQKGKHRSSRVSMKKEHSIPFDKMDMTSLKYLQKLISLYVHPVIVSDDTTMPNNTSRDVKVTQERHRSEAELRSVYTLFIKPIIKAELSSDPEKNKDLFMLLNDILNLATSVIDGFKGHLRQFIVDDKGTAYFHSFTFAVTFLLVLFTRTSPHHPYLLSPMQLQV
jgi:hypothetical protein